MADQIEMKDATEAALVDGDKVWGTDVAETGVKVFTDVVGEAASQTLTNKTLTSPTISDPTITGTVGGTPAIVLTNGTLLPIAGITGLDAGIATWLATSSSANLAAAMTDESGSGSLVFGTSPTITNPTLNSSVVDIGDNTAYTLLAANSGKLHIIPDLTGDLTITVAEAAGLFYEFWYTGAAADAQDWLIDTGSDTNFFSGGLVHLDTDAGSAGDEVVTVFSDGNSNSKITILTPEAGTVVRMYCNGTSWAVNGTVVSASAPSFADQ